MKAVISIKTLIMKSVVFTSKAQMFTFFSLLRIICYLGQNQNQGKELSTYVYEKFRVLNVINEYFLAESLSLFKV